MSVKKASELNKEVLDLGKISFLQEMSPEQLETIEAIQKYSSKLKTKIYYFADNCGVVSSINVEEVFSEFLDMFFQNPDLAFDQEYSDDEEYFVYPYIVKRLEYFMYDVVKKAYDKRNTELRIFEDKKEESDRIPYGFISEDKIPGCARTKDEFNQLFDDCIEESVVGLDELSKIYDFNFLDYLLLEAKNTMLEKSLTIYEISRLLNVDGEKISKLRSLFGVKASRLKSKVKSSMSIDEIDEIKTYFKDITGFLFRNKLDIFSVASFNIDEAIAAIRE